MNGIRSAVSSLVRKANARIRLGPAQLFQSTDCLWLALVDDSLLNLSAGTRARLDSGVADLNDDAALASLVKAAYELCKDDQRPIALLLPYGQFLYSHYSVQLGAEHAGNRELVLSAIALQKDILLPAIEQDLALAAGAGQTSGVAFWFPQSTLRRLEEAFQAASLHLVAVLPRALAIAPSDAAQTSYVIADTDLSSRALIRIEGRVATLMLGALRAEFANQDIESAWAEQAAPLLADSPIGMTRADDWLKLKGVDRPLTDYLFFTQEFLERVGKKNNERRTLAYAALGVAAAFVLALPLVYQWVDTIRLEGRRDDARRAAAVAERHRNEILAVEGEWGVVYEYPEADVPAVLLALNSVIRNSLTSFSLDKSIIEIQGSAANPEQLNARLAAHPLFDGIKQSRSTSSTSANTSNDRFGLEMTLAGPRYEDYAQKYKFK